MREFKFRGWMKKQQRMTTPEVVGEYGWYETSADFEDGIKCRQPFDTLMQYTGLNDKNGKEIYEGDIIRMAGKFWYVVRYEDAKFVCYHTREDYGRWGNLHRLFDHDFSNYGWAVVGNIYENPDLLATSNQQQP